MHPESALGLLFFGAFLFCKFFRITHLSCRGLPPPPFFGGGGGGLDSYPAKVGEEPCPHGPQRFGMEGLGLERVGVEWVGLERLDWKGWDWKGGLGKARDLFAAWREGQ